MVPGIGLVYRAINKTYGAPAWGFSIRSHPNPPGALEGSKSSLKGVANTDKEDSALLIKNFYCTFFFLCAIIIVYLVCLEKHLSVTGPLSMTDQISSDANESDVIADIEEVSELDVRAHAESIDEVIENTEDDDYDEVETIRQQIVQRGAPPAQWEQKQLEFFTIHIHEQEIKSLSAGLNREEVLNYYGLSEGILPDYDQFFFDISFIRGRMEAKHRAVKALFTQMKDSRHGTNAALTYLNRFADSFQGETGQVTTPKAVRIELVD